MHFKPTQPPIYGSPEKKLRALARHLHDMFWQPEVQHAAEVPISASFFFSPHIIKVTKETTQPSSAPTLSSTDTKQSTWHHFSHPPTPSRKAWGPTLVHVGSHQTPNALIMGTQPHPLQQAVGRRKSDDILPLGKGKPTAIQWSLGSLSSLQLSSLQKTQ